MATNISNSVLVDEIDFIAAVAKAMATIYTATYDAYDFMVREQNPDDLLSGVDAAVAVRTRLEAGTGPYAQFSNLTQWLNTRASAAGSTGLDTLLTARGQRAPYSYDQYVYYPTSNAHMTPRNVFYDEEIVMGDFHFTNGYSAGTALTVSGSHNWVVAEVQSVGGTPATWVLSTPVYYGDGSTGTEETVLTAGLAQYAQVNLNNNPIGGFSQAGTSPIILKTTGMVAGQWVLLVDNTYPVALSANVATGARTVTVSPSQIGWYTPGDNIWISDQANRETGTVENINYEYGTVTLETATTLWYLTATGAYINKAVGSGDGFQQQGVIGQVSGANAMNFSGTLQHSFGTGGYAQRLVRSIVSSSTNVGGGAAYEVTFQTKSERTIAQ